MAYSTFKLLHIITEMNFNFFDEERKCSIKTGNMGIEKNIKYSASPLIKRTIIQYLTIY